MKKLALALLLLFVLSCGRDDDDVNTYVLHYTVQSSNPVTITALVPEFGNFPVFNHPGGIWALESEYEEYTAYSIKVESAQVALEDIYVKVEIQIDDEALPVAGGMMQINSANPILLFGSTPVIMEGD